MKHAVHTCVLLLPILHQWPVFLGLREDELQRDDVTLVQRAPVRNTVQVRSAEGENGGQQQGQV